METGPEMMLIDHRSLLRHEGISYFILRIYPTHLAKGTARLSSKHPSCPLRCWDPTTSTPLKALVDSSKTRHCQATILACFIQFQMSMYSLKSLYRLLCCIPHTTIATTLAIFLSCPTSIPTCVPRRPLGAPLS